MTEARPTRLRALIPWLVAGLPVASWIAVAVYASRFDGWGSWATAPLFLIPIGLGLAVAAYEMLRIVTLPRAGREARLAWARLLLASPPVLWLLWRLIVSR